MLNFTKAALCTAAAGAMAFTSAAPAEAQRYRDRDNDGISAGEIIAGALIIGGIAAVASASNNDRRNYRYRDNYYRSNGNPRLAVDRCVRAAQNDARRSGYRRAQVVDINRVRDTRRGWNISGRIAVDGQRGYRDNRRGYDRRGYNNRRGDQGRFSCNIRNGRVVDMDYRGIRGMRRF
ncbi:MAG: hypothetical protein GW855_06855 [Erythrobacter sp.]|nr:hypothetical protein [Erythrobacter sp.]